MVPILTIDFEASCLPVDGRSFPVEVGVASLGGWSQSWLIRPADGWADWTWTGSAEATHGISRDRLAREGQAVADVMRGLNAVTAGARVIADHDLDTVWLATLAAAAGIQPTFRIGHIAELIDIWTPDPAKIRRAVEAADRANPIRHRAAADARWLATVVDKLGPTGPGIERRSLFAWSDPATERHDLIEHAA